MKKPIPDISPSEIEAELKRIGINPKELWIESRSKLCYFCDGYDCLAIISRDILSRLASVPAGASLTEFWAIVQNSNAELLVVKWPEDFLENWP